MHYQVPLTEDNSVYMEFKTGKWIPCNPPTAWQTGTATAKASTLRADQQAQKTYQTAASRLAAAEQQASQSAAGLGRAADERKQYDESLQKAVRARREIIDSMARRRRMPARERSSSPRTGSRPGLWNA